MGAPTLGGDDFLETSWARDLLALRFGWDSYRAVPITSVALETVGRIAVVPLANGGVQLELHQDGADLEIEILPSGEVTSVFFEVRR